MLDEILYMQIRLFRMFRERLGISSREANRLFDQGDVWDFVSSNYDMLYLSGDESALEDVLNRLDFVGVAY